MPLTFVGTFAAYVFGSICLTWPGSSRAKSISRAESEEERRILLFVACGTLKTDKGKYRLSRL